MDDLIADLRSKENVEAYWDFRKNDKRNHVHSIIKYPAVMVPNMQGEIFDLVLKHDSSIHSVLDPFMGSGTILVEGIIRNLDVFGIDINPLSYLAVKVKMYSYKIDVLTKKIENLFQNIETQDDIVNHKFSGIEKWYQPNVIRDLSKLRQCILKEPELKYRQFFWVAFADIAKQADNARTSTFKLHIKLATTIQETIFDCLDEFKNKILANMKAVSMFKTLRSANDAKIYYGDSRKVLSDRRRFKENSIDLVITSPPYGDNATTITYGQYSVLPLRWIPLQDIHDTVSSDTIASLSQIDRDSLGGKKYGIEAIEQTTIFDTSRTFSSFYYDLIADKKEEKAQRVASFLLDFSDIIKKLHYVVKPGKLLVFTVGNRQVNKTEFPLNQILREIAESYDMDFTYDFRRNIIKNKNYVDTSVQGFKTINKETIVILRKRNT